MQQFVDKWRCNANRAKLVQSRIKAINRLEDEFEVDDFGVVVRQEADEDVEEKRYVHCDGGRRGEGSERKNRPN